MILVYRANPIYPFPLSDDGKLPILLRLESLQMAIGEDTIKEAKEGEEVEGPSQTRSFYLQCTNLDLLLITLSTKDMYKYSLSSGTGYSIQSKLGTRTLNNSLSIDSTLLKFYSPFASAFAASAFALPFYRGHQKSFIPRLQEGCRQVEAEVICNSSDKILQAWEGLFQQPLYRARLNGRP